MRQHRGEEVSPLFMIGRGNSDYRYDELDAYDDNWDLRDVPLETTKASSDQFASSNDHDHDGGAETELTSLTTKRRHRSLHHDEEEAVLCPLVFADEDDDEHSSGSQSSISSSFPGFRRRRASASRRNPHALGGWRLRRRGHSQRRLAIIIGGMVLVAAALAFLAYFPTISHHAVSFKESLNESRHLAGEMSDEEGYRITFPAALSQLSKAVSTALESLF